MSTTSERTVTPSQQRTYPAYAHGLARRVLLTREMAVVAGLLVVYIWSWFNVAYFDQSLTLFNLLRDNATILVIALPMALIITTGEIDLSVSSTLAVSAAVTGVLVKDGGLSVPVAAAIAILVGCLLGAVNGLLVAYAGLPSLAVTIGTLALYRGLVEGIIKTKQVSGFPDRWQDLPGTAIGASPLPVVVIPIALMAIAFALLLHFTSFGRGIFEIGLNDEAAHFSGVNVPRTKLILFVLSGAVSAFAGVYSLMRSNSVAIDTGVGVELQVIAAVLLGGVSIFGGRGALHGVIAGVLLIGVLSSSLRLQSQGSETITIIIGLLLVASVVSSNFLPRIRELGTSLRPRQKATAAQPTTPPSSGENSER